MNKKKKGMSPLVGLAILFIFGILCIVIGLSSGSDEPAPAATQATTEAVAQATTQAVTQATTQATTQSASDAEKYQSFITLAEASVTKGFGNDHSIKKDGDTVIVNVWTDGVTADMMAAANGNVEVQNGWNQLKTNMETISKSLYKTMQTVGIPDGHVMLNLLNDTNLDNSLLVYYDDGVLVYDALSQQ